MVLGFFLHSLLPLKSGEDLRREAFTLAYGSGGAFTIGDIDDMGREERDGYLELLIDQKQAEERQIRKAKSKGGRSKSNR